MICSKQSQAGMTLISWVLILAVAGILLMGVLRLFPVYMEHFNAASSLKSLSSDQGLQGSSPAEIRKALMKRLQINDVERVHPEDIIVERAGNVYRVTMEYEAVVPFIYNISFLVHFDDMAEVAAR
ncbi:MAG: DUF4845 domain-containing protein [Thiohalomonadaceae bacterium]